MPDLQTLLIALVIAVMVAIVLLVLLLLRRPDAAFTSLREKLGAHLREEQRQGRLELRESLQSQAQAQLQRIEQFAQKLGDFSREQHQQLRTQGEQHAERFGAFARAHEAAFSQFRDALREETRDSRTESAQAQARHQDSLSQRVQDLTERTDKRLDEFRIAIGEDARKLREESRAQQQQFGQALGERLKELTERNEQRMAELRATLDSQLKSMQADNAQKLEQMRATVEEKLQSTLETRLGESFRLVSERLEAVQRGLGEMQQLASDVGSLQRVLTNVKQRGGFGETQLGALLEDVLTASQYERNVATLPGSSERVEFAIRLPGTEGATQVWLPIDAKFPREDYERLVEAQEQADAAAALTAGNALETRLRLEAKKIREKYVGPPHTTDFALLFLPTEGLYAEAIRRPGLFDALQRDHRVTLVGPTTLLAVLNALQMGFRTLAIEKRSSEVWQTLGQVKTEFGKFGASLDAVKKKLAEATNKIEDTSVRSRAIERKLRGVEALPELMADAAALPGLLDALEPEE